MKISVLDPQNIKVENYGAINVRELLSESDSDNMSVAIIDLEGTNRKNKNKISDMFYFILRGEGVFNIDGKDYPVRETSLICIPRDTVYIDSGKMTMLSFCSPRFDPKSVEYLD